MKRTCRAVSVLAVAAAALTAGATASAAPALAAGRAGVVTLYSARVFSGPRQVVAGPYGALWYTNSGNNSIGRITTNGHVKQAFHNRSIRHPEAITVGADGALWFTNAGNNSIGRITTRGR